MTEQEGVVVKQALGLVTLWSSGSPRRIFNLDTEPSKKEEEAWKEGSQDDERGALTHLFVRLNGHHRRSVSGSTWGRHHQDPVVASAITTGTQGPTLPEETSHLLTV